MCAKEDTNAMAARDSIAFIVGPSAQEFADVQRCLSDWKCVNVPVSEGASAAPSITATPQLIVVYALKDKKKTLAVCERLRNSAETSGVPILLVISRYLVSQGTAVKRMGNAELVLSPLDEKRMREKIAELVGG